MTMAKLYEISGENFATKLASGEVRMAHEGVRP